MMKEFSSSFHKGLIYMSDYLFALVELIHHFLKTSARIWTILPLHDLSHQHYQFVLLSIVE